MQGTGGFRLVVRRGPQPNQVYELNKDLISLGRDITNDIVINDPEVSRHHCRMTRTSTGYTMEDLGSTNGTFVNGQRLTAARPLTNGDMIGLGETVTLAYEGAAVQAPAELPGQQQTLVSSTAPPPPAQDYQQPPQQQQPYAPPGAQQPPYAAPPGQQPYYAQQPSPGYDYEYDEEPRGGTGRWLALGCGCLVVLGIVTLVVAAIIIDTANLWCDVPLVPDLFNLYCPAPGASLPMLLAMLL